MRPQLPWPGALSQRLLGDLVPSSTLPRFPGIGRLRLGGNEDGRGRVNTYAFSSTSCGWLPARHLCKTAPNSFSLAIFAVDRPTTICRCGQLLQEEPVYFSTQSDVALAKIARARSERGHLAFRNLRRGGGGLLAVAAPDETTETKRAVKSSQTATVTIPR